MKAMDRGEELGARAVVRMQGTWVIAVALSLVLVCGGCVLPAPHTRVHAYGVTGRIVDATRDDPVPGASVRGLDWADGCARSDSRGEFRLRAKRGWHGAYFVGPICLSLLPDWDVTAPSREIEVSAPGYVARVFAIRNYRASGSDVVVGQIDGAYLKVEHLELSPATEGISALGD